jgi:glycosyltransferase involved in cell wall biosynthesis
MIVFVVTGRLGENLVYYKTLPIAADPEISKVFVFCEKPLKPYPKIQYIILPGWLVNFRILILRRFLRLLYEPFQLLSKTLSIKPAVINGVYTLPKGLNSLLVAKLTGSKCIISVLGGKEEIEPKIFPQRFWYTINKWMLENANAITTKGNHDSSYIKSIGIDPVKIFTFNGFIDTDRFVPIQNERSIDILFVGTFYELKGPFRMLQVFQTIKEYIPDIMITMIGDGPDYKETISKAIALGLKNNIEFTGFIPNTEEYYKKAKTLILMSRTEGMPNCMLEAMASGCVPVVPNVGNISQIIRHKNNGWLMETHNDIVGYASAFKELLLNDSLREGVAINARKTVLENFSLQSQQVQFKKIINYLNLNRNGRKQSLSLF